MTSIGHRASGIGLQVVAGRHHVAQALRLPRRESSRRQPRPPLLPKPQDGPLRKLFYGFCSLLFTFAFWAVAIAAIIAAAGLFFLGVVAGR